MDGVRTQAAHPIRTFKHSLSILVTFSLRLKSYFLEVFTVNALHRFMFMLI